MNILDLITMIDNLGRSLAPVQALVTGFAYMLGILFFIIALSKLRKIADARANSSSGESMYVPLAYAVGGAALIYIPSYAQVMSNSFFGAYSTLAYANPNPVDFFSAFALLIRTAGVIWFVRGTSLIVESSNPGSQHGKKGVAFLIGGILAMNFDNTAGIINDILQFLEKALNNALQGSGYMGNS